MKLCECGCGQPAPIAKLTCTRDGTVKGQPRRFVNGHQQQSTVAVGNRYGRLVVVESAGRNEWGGPAWLCRCDCGNYHRSAGCHLSNNRHGVRSCGCLRGGTPTHGLSGTKAHHVWCAMLRRCDKERGHPRYAGRGIRVCERWLSVENFVADMGQPLPGMSIDRIDNNGNYEPGNCRWADRKTQAQNTRRNRNYMFNGASRCIAEIARMVGCTHSTLSHRLDRGLSLEQAIKSAVEHRKTKEATCVG